MSFELLKILHTLAAVITILGFVLRGYWMLQESDLLQHRVSRIAPHIVDTLFLLSGIGLVIAMHLNVLSQPWLLAKLAGLVAYIVLGTIALRRGTTKAVRSIAYVAAIAVFAYIIGVAISKSPASWIRLLTA